VHDEQPQKMNTINSASLAVSDPVEIIRLRSWGMDAIILW
jgi:hypothetical protein